MGGAQAILFGDDAIGFDPRLLGLRRIELGGGAWLEHLPGWLEGHERLFEELRAGLDWRASERRMYERTVEVPRLAAAIPEDGPGHPVLSEAGSVLAARYGRSFPRVHLHLYRDAADSVAMHSDRAPAGELETVLPILSLGAPRRFSLRPGSSLRRRLSAAAARGRSFQLGWGDLLVMGGTAAYAWEHGVPKAARVDGERISVMYRPARALPAAPRKK